MIRAGRAQEPVQEKKKNGAKTMNKDSSMDNDSGTNDDSSANHDAGVTRRDFLKTSAKTGAGLAALGGITFITEPQRVFGANDRVQVAIIGLNGRGGDHIKELARQQNATIAAFC